MTFHDWIDQEIAAGRNRTRTEAYRAVRATMAAIGTIQVSEATLASVDRGAKIRSYERAQSIETATGGDVTIRELCE